MMFVYARGQNHDAWLGSWLCLLVSCSFSSWKNLFVSSLVNRYCDWTKLRKDIPLCPKVCVDYTDFLSDSLSENIVFLHLVVIIMSTDSEVLCGLGPWRPSFLQSLASKKVYIVFYGCLGIIQGMFFSYLRFRELISHYISSFY